MREKSVLNLRFSSFICRRRFASPNGVSSSGPDVKTVFPPVWEQIGNSPFCCSDKKRRQQGKRKEGTAFFLKAASAFSFPVGRIPQYKKEEDTFCVFPSFVVVFVFKNFFFFVSGRGTQYYFSGFHHSPKWWLRRKKKRTCLQKEEKSFYARHP